MSETSTRLSWALQGSVVALAVLTAVGLSGCRDDNAGGTSPRIVDWQRATAAAITPMAQRVPVIAQEASEWEQDTLSASDYRPELATTLAVTIRARDGVSKLPQFPGQPLVDSLYLASMNLYVASAQADQASLDLATTDLRRQVARLAERLRVLGDRVFDQGRVLTGQSLVSGGLSGAKVELPSPVPDWTAEGLAPGPPLAPAPQASVARPNPPVTGGPEVRRRLSQLIADEANRASRAAGLTAAGQSSALSELATYLSEIAHAV